MSDVLFWQKKRNAKVLFITFTHEEKNWFNVIALLKQRRQMNELKIKILFQMNKTPAGCSRTFDTVHICNQDYCSLMCIELVSIGDPLMSS